MVSLEKEAAQRSSLLTNLTSRSGDNLAILLERRPEYYKPPYVTEFERSLAFQGKTTWSWEFWHEPNSSTEDMRLNKWIWQHSQTELSD